MLKIVSKLGQGWVCFQVYGRNSATREEVNSQEKDEKKIGIMNLSRRQYPVRRTA